MTIAQGLTIPVPGVGSVTYDSPLDAFGTIGATLSSPGLWKRIGLGWLGALLIFWGLIIILAGTRAAQTAVAGVAKIATKGIV